MDKLLRFGTLLVCLGSSASALAQMYDDLPVPAYSINCRAVVGQAEIDGTIQQIVGRACLQSDGTWQIVQSADGSVLWYPLAAYPYPDPWYWGPPFFVGAGASFIFVDRFHHFHHFHRFHRFHRFDRFNRFDRFDHFHRFNQMDHGRFGAPMGAGFHRGPFPGVGMRGFGGTRGGSAMHQFGGMSGFGGIRRR